MSAVEKFPMLLLEAEEESSAVPPCFSHEGINVSALPLPPPPLPLPYLHRTLGTTKSSETKHIHKHHYRWESAVGPRYLRRRLLYHGLNI
jgi:hypothetical protein